MHWSKGPNAEATSQKIKKTLAAKKAAGWVSISRRSTGKRWKVENRQGTSHECAGPGCTNGRHTSGVSTRFQKGSTQTHPNSLVNFKLANERKKLWKNGTSYEGQFTYTLKAQVWARDESRCQDCDREAQAGERTGVVHHLDHDKSNNDLGNLVLLCRSCHWRRHRRVEPATK